MIKLEATCPMCSKTWDTTQMVLTKIKKGLITSLCKECKIKEDKTKLLPCICKECGETMMQTVYYIRHMNCGSDVTGVCSKCLRIRKKTRVHEGKRKRAVPRLELNGCTLREGKSVVTYSKRCSGFNTCEFKISCLDLVSHKTDWKGFTSNGKGYIKKELFCGSAIPILNPDSEYTVHC